MASTWKDFKLPELDEGKDAPKHSFSIQSLDEIFGRYKITSTLAHISSMLATDSIPRKLALLVAIAENYQTSTTTEQMAALVPVLGQIESFFKILISPKSFNLKEQLSNIKNGLFDGEVLQSNYAFDPFRPVEDQIPKTAFAQLLEKHTALLRPILGVIALFMAAFGVHKMVSLAPLSKISSNIVSLSKLILAKRVIKGEIESAVDVMLHTLYEMCGAEYKSTVEEKLSTFSDQVRSLQEQSRQVIEGYKYDFFGSIYNQQIGTLTTSYKQLENMYTKLTESEKSTFNFRDRLQEIYRNICTIRERRVALIKATGGKQEPVRMWIAGRPGIGKTHISKTIAKKLEGGTCSVYSRNVMDEYWSGYVGQSVCIWDDMAQQADGRDVVEWHMFASDAAMDIVGAAIEDKGTPFTSKYNIATSNFEYITSTGKIADLLAVNRRRDILIYAKNEALEEYKRKNHCDPPAGFYTTYPTEYFLLHPTAGYDGTLKVEVNNIHHGNEYGVFAKVTLQEIIEIAEEMEKYKREKFRQMLLAAMPDSGIIPQTPIVYDRSKFDFSIRFKKNQPKPVSTQENILTEDQIVAGMLRSAGEDELSPDTLIEFDKACSKIEQQQALNLTPISHRVIRRRAAILLMGPPGTGKTCLVYEAIEEGMLHKVTFADIQKPNWYAQLPIDKVIFFDDFTTNQQFLDAFRTCVLEFDSGEFCPMGLIGCLNPNTPLWQGEVVGQIVRRSVAVMFKPKALMSVFKKVMNPDADVKERSKYFSVKLHPQSQQVYGFTSFTTLSTDIREFLGASTSEKNQRIVSDFIIPRPDDWELLVEVGFSYEECANLSARVVMANSHKIKVFKRNEDGKVEQMGWFAAIEHIRKLRTMVQTSCAHGSPTEFVRGLNKEQHKVDLPICLLKLIDVEFIFMTHDGIMQVAMIDFQQSEKFEITEKAIYIDDKIVPFNSDNREYQRMLYKLFKPGTVITPENCNKSLLLELRKDENKILGFILDCIPYLSVLMKSLAVVTLFTTISNPQIKDNEEEESEKKKTKKRRTHKDVFGTSDSSSDDDDSNPNERRNRPQKQQPQDNNTDNDKSGKPNQKNIRVNNERKSRKAQQEQPKNNNSDNDMVTRKQPNNIRVDNESVNCERKSRSQAQQQQPKDNNSDNDLASRKEPKNIRVNIEKIYEEVERKAEKVELRKEELENDSEPSVSTMLEDDSDNMFPSMNEINDFMKNKRPQLVKKNEESESVVKTIIPNESFCLNQSLNAYHNKMMLESRKALDTKQYFEKKASGNEIVEVDKFNTNTIISAVEKFQNQRSDVEKKEAYNFELYRKKHNLIMMEGTIITNRDSTIVINCDCEYGFVYSNYIYYAAEGEVGSFVIYNVPISDKWREVDPNSFIGEYKLRNSQFKVQDVILKTIDEHALKSLVGANITTMAPFDIDIGCIFATTFTLGLPLDKEANKIRPDALIDIYRQNPTCRMPVPAHKMLSKMFPTIMNKYTPPEGMIDSQVRPKINMLVPQMGSMLYMGEHCVHGILVDNCTVITVAHYQSDEPKLLFREKIYELEMKKRNVNTDLAVYKSKEYIPNARNISNMFMRNEDLSKALAVQTKSLPGVLVVPDPGTPHVYCNHCEISAMLTATINLDGVTGRYNANLGQFGVTGVSLKGDCGSPLLLQNKQTDGKIIGIHRAGSQTTSVCAFITRQFVEKAIKNEFEEESCDNIKPIVIPEQIQMREVTKPCAKTGVTVVGRLAKPIYCPDTTRVHRTGIVLEGLDIHEPSIMHTKDPRAPGNEIALEALSRYARPGSIAHFDRSEITEAMLEIGNELANNILLRRKTTRVFTLEEAINVPPFLEYPNARPIDRTGSAGFPYNYDGNKLTRKADYLCFDEDTLKWSFSDTTDGRKVARRVTELIEDAKQGVIHMNPFVAYLKDETLKKKKIYEDRKTRMFFSGSYEYLLAYRRYFMSAMLRVSEMAKHIPCKVGTSSAMGDWHHMAYRFLAKSHIGFASDVSNFDSSVRTLFLEEVNHVYDTIYERTMAPGYNKAEAAQIRRSLHRSVEGAHVIYGCNVYKLNQAMVSGCPGTAIENSFVLWSLYYMVWKRLAMKHDPSSANYSAFRNNVELAVYGDDNMCTVAQGFEWFNFNTFKEEAYKIGFSITDAAKAGGAVPDYLPFEQLEFLKRSFVYEQGWYMAKLAASSLGKAIAWIRDSTSYRVQKKHVPALGGEWPISTNKELIGSSLSGIWPEMALHGKIAYYDWRDQILTQAGTLGIMVDAPRWKDACSRLDYEVLE